jgi:anti-sigma B factor antagonist
VAQESPRAREDPVVAVSGDGGATVVRLAGELDLYNANVVRQALVECAERDPERLVVDLSEVEFIDSTALGALLEARSRLTDGAFVLAAPGLEARRALEVSGLDRHFEIHDSVASALVR